MDPPPTNQGVLEIQKSIEIQQPTAARQSFMTEFITVRNPPIQPMDGLATTLLENDSGCNLILESSTDTALVSINSDEINAGC